MIDSNFKISVILPVYNCKNYISETLDCVLNQSFPPYEVIVIDSSTDGTSEVIQKYSSKIKYLFQPKQGIGAARNAGVEMASGQYFAHLDADDVWIKDKLEIQRASFLDDPELDIAGTYMESFFSPELTGEDKKSVYCPPDPIPGFSASAILVKKEAFFRVGLYETHWKVGQDLNWFIRAKEMGLKEIMIPQVLVRRRLHKTNTDTLNKEFALERVRILKASLDRRRAKK